MEVIDLGLAGLKLIRPDIFGDARGFFLETYSASRYAAIGVGVTFVQDNHSRSVRGTLRGLHYQSTPGQSKLVRVVSGRIWDAAVDIRPDSSTFGQWRGVELDAERHEQVFIPVGFAHGFCVLSDTADVLYKVDAPYDARTECTFNHADPELAIKWPVTSPVLSARDAQAEPFSALRARLAGR